MPASELQLATSRSWTEDGLSEFLHVILNQARVHEFYLDVMRKSAVRLEPFYNRKLINLTIDLQNATGETASYLVAARIEQAIDGRPTATETVRAHYVVGCDGAQ